MSLRAILEKRVFTDDEVGHFTAGWCIAPGSDGLCGEHVANHHIIRVVAASLFCIGHLGQYHEESQA